MGKLSPRLVETVRHAFGYRMPRVGGVVSRWLIRNIPRQMRAEIVPGIFVDMNFDDAVDLGSYWRGRAAEAPLGYVLSDWCRPPDCCFFDIGANYGFFSYLIYSLNSTCEVFSFEPNPATFQRLATVQQQNDLRRLHPFHMGLSDAAGKLKMTCYLNNSGASTFGLDNGELPIASEELVEVNSFDLWADANLTPSARASNSWVAKIDTEGFELRVLHGMARSLAERKFRGLAVEINEFVLKTNGLDASAIHSYLDGFGYRALTAPEWQSYKRGGPTTENAFFVRRD